MVKAYEALTGEKFKLFGINDAAGITFDLELETTGTEQAFKVLGVRYGATEQEIEIAVKKQIKKINNAFELLTGKKNLDSKFQSSKR